MTQVNTNIQRHETNCADHEMVYTLQFTELLNHCTALHEVSELIIGVERHACSELNLNVLVAWHDKK